MPLHPSQRATLRARAQWILENDIDAGNGIRILVRVHDVLTLLDSIEALEARLDRVTDREVMDAGLRAAIRGAGGAVGIAAEDVLRVVRAVAADEPKAER